LIEIIYELERRQERMERKLEKAREKLKQRSVRMEQAGSLAEVAAVIAGLFDAADETAAMYLSGVRSQAEIRRNVEGQAS
jgi:uncharacterized protein with PhoU and TrkA domain